MTSFFPTPQTPASTCEERGCNNDPVIYNPKTPKTQRQRRSKQTSEDPNMTRHQTTYRPRMRRARR